MDPIVLTTMVVMRESWLFSFIMKMVRKSTQKHAKFNFHAFHSFHVYFVDCFLALFFIPTSFSLIKYCSVSIRSV